MNTADCDYIKFGEIEARLRAFHGNPSLTRGHWEGTNDCEARDAEWNLLDQMHRLFIHKVYGKTLCLARSSSFSSTITTLKVLGFPIVVSINDVRIRPGFYYQTIVFLNLIHFHMYLEIIPMGEQSRTRVDWFIASHPLFKWMHGFLNKRYYRTLEVLNTEDTLIRIRRMELRRRGFKFAYEEPNYVNSNSTSNNVCPPPLNGPQRISLASLPIQNLTKVTAGNIDFLVYKESHSEIRIWTDVCPHEGGPLSQGKICNGQMECPWHGLKFAGARLAPDHPQAEFSHYRFELDRDELIVEEKAVQKPIQRSIQV